MTADARHILIVDDDATLRNRLKSYLEGEGFCVSAADGGAAMRRVMAAEPVDLVLLDLIMPGEDGLTLTRHLRATSHAAIIILTGKDEPVDRIVGLEMGADDYVAKPFSPRELLARVRSVLRRTSAAPPERQAEPPRHGLSFAGFHLDKAARSLLAPSGEDVRLTTAEFNLLCAFVDNPNRVLTRDQLLDAMAGRDWQPYDRSIDLHISHLRRKIEADPKKPKLIKSVRGAGYMFAAKPDGA